MTTSSIPEGCKPFDLERALAGDPVVTRGGDRVAPLMKSDSDMLSPVIGVVSNNVRQWTAEGRYLIVDDVPSDFDIFMAPKKRTVWMNLCFDGKAYWYDSEEEADGCHGHDRIGNRAWPVEIED